MSSFFPSLIAWILYLALILLPMAGLCLVEHFLLSLPARRRDRALFFLDILETALRHGQPIEQAILDAAEMKDKVMGVRFFLLAAHIENGFRFGEALEKVPRFLPPQVNAILRAGEKLGNLEKVLPACREALRRTPDSVQVTMNYMTSVLLLFSPIAVWMLWILDVVILPRFQEMAFEYKVPVGSMTRLAIDALPVMIGFEVAVFVILSFLMKIYFAGPGFMRWLKIGRVPVTDWIAWQVPWKRKKLQRVFSAMLAVLLDGGLPETQAVQLAADSTANEICNRKAQRMLSSLEDGKKIEQSVRHIDGSGEFHWRLSNATHARSGFLDALRGWHEALDAQAFRQEETAVQITTSGIVIMNGIIVGLMATAMFGILIALLYGALETA